MSVETEKIIQDVQNVTNIFDKEGGLKNPATRYFTYQERIDRQKELDEIESFINQPPEVLRTIDITPQRMRMLRERRKRLRTDLESNSPPTNISPETKNELYKLKRELAEKIRIGMLPTEEMRRNPTGAIGRNVRWLKATKNFQLAYKNVCRILDPHSEDADLANIEMLRPERFIQGQPSTFMGDAQIPGHISFSHIPDKKWEDAGLPLVNENSPMAQAERREAAEKPDEQSADVNELKAKLERYEAAEQERQRLERERVEKARETRRKNQDKALARAAKRFEKMNKEV